MTTERSGWLVAAAAAALVFAVGVAPRADREVASDLATTLEVKLDLLRQRGADGLAVDVHTADGLVTLGGHAASDEDKEKVESIARGVGGMRPVRNLIQVTRRFAALDAQRVGSR